jgi:hypothetical protein
MIGQSAREEFAKMTPINMFVRAIFALTASKR